MKTLKKVGMLAVALAVAAIGITGCKTNIEVAEAVTFTSEDVGEGGVQVKMATKTEGATIYYTIDGNTPTKESTEYKEPVTFSTDTTIKAIAVKDGIENSPVSVATVSIKTKTITETKTVTEIKTETVEKPVYVTTLPAGTYTVYHQQQKTTGGNSPADYVTKSDDTEEKTVAENTKMEDIAKNYEGFTAKAMGRNGSAVYIFYDRNTITYTFNAGEGKFSDGTTEKTISGLFEADVASPSARELKAPEGKKFSNKWQAADGSRVPSVFGAENMEFTAVWVDEDTAPDYSTAEVGDIILKDGSICKAAEYVSASNEAAAVIVRAKTDDKPALGVGIKHNKSDLVWCEPSAVGYSKKIAALQGDTTSGFTDGATGWEELKKACSDATEHPEYYPAWNYCLTYAKDNGLEGELAKDWYFPTVAELYTIYENQRTVDTSLKKAGGSQFYFSSYYSSSQSASYYTEAYYLDFHYGTWSYANKSHVGVYSVCAVRAFN